MGNLTAKSQGEPARMGSPVCDICVTVRWEHEECTGSTASAFGWLSRKVARTPASKVLLDMSACGYMNVTGLNYLIEWSHELRSQGIVLKVTGLAPMIARIFALAKLDWILA